MTQVPPPTDPPDAVEQLQRALLTLIGTARVVLDAAEAVVADRRRFDDLAATGRDLAATGRGMAGAVLSTLLGEAAPADTADTAGGTDGGHTEKA